MNCSRRVRAQIGVNGLAIVVAVGLAAADFARGAVITRDVNVTLIAENIESYDLDVDLDGATDFTFTAALVLDPVVSVGFDVVDFPFASNNGVVIEAFTGDGFPTASLLGPGDTVSSSNLFASASFDQGNLFFFTSFDPPTGNFEGRTGFLGLRFDRPSGIAFGFAQITVNPLNSPDNPLGLTIGVVGYEDVPGQAATIVPEPGSLLLMGLGVLSLGLVRQLPRRSRRVGSRSEWMPIAAGR